MQPIEGSLFSPFQKTLYRIKTASGWNFDYENEIVWERFDATVNRIRASEGITPPHFDLFQNMFRFTSFEIITWESFYSYIKDVLTINISRNMTCKFCGQPAGFFRTVHKECKLAHSNAVTSIFNEISQSITSTTDFTNLNNQITTLAKTGFVKKSELTELYILGFDKAVEVFLEDGIISNEEENKISDYKKYFNLDQSILNKNGSFEKVAKGLILNDIFQGKLPENRLNISGNSPFLLEKGETLIWIFQNVGFYEQRSKTTYVGKSNGISIKIAKGVYYKAGQFKGNPVTNNQMTLIANGVFALTNKNIYFASATKSFKTSYKKLISMTQYSDGIGIQKDGVSAKPQIFKGLDGWFTYNIISNLKIAS